MELRRFKCALFVNASLADLMVAVNDFTAGKAVAAIDSGTVAYAAGFVKTQQWIGQQLVADSGSFALALYYTE